MRAVFFIQQKHNNYGNGRNASRQKSGNSSTRYSELGAASTAENEEVVEEHIHQVRSEQDNHRYPGVAQAFEELFKRSKQHDGRNTVSHDTVIRQSRLYHFHRLPHAEKERLERQLEQHHDDAEPHVEHHTIHQPCTYSFRTFTPHQFTYHGCQTHRNAKREEKKQRCHLSAKRYGCQRKGVLTAPPSDHDIICQLHKNLTELRYHQRERQLQILDVIRHISPYEYRSLHSLFVVGNCILLHYLRIYLLFHNCFALEPIHIDGERFSKPHVSHQFGLLHSRLCIEPRDIVMLIGAGIGVDMDIAHVETGEILEEMASLTGIDSEIGQSSLHDSPRLADI